MKNLFILFVLILSFNAVWAQDHSLSFDGNNDYLAANNLIHQEQGTWEAWVQKSNWADHHDDILFGNGLPYTSDDCFYLSLHPSAGLHFRYGGVNLPGNEYLSTLATQNFVANSWHHIAISWSRDTSSGITALYLYLDGNVVMADTTLAYIDPTVSTQCFIGGDPSYTRFGEGAMDDVRIWNEFRNPQTINYYASKRINYPTTGLLAFLNFNTGTAAGANVNLTHFKNLADTTQSFQLMNFSLNGPTSNLISTTRTTISFVEGTDGNNPQIRIHGTRLEGVNTLTIGSSSFSNFLLQDSSMIIVSSAGNPNGIVALATPLGGFATSSSAFNLISQKFLQFDGVDDYLKKDDMNLNSDEGTLAVWVSKDNWSNHHMDYLFGNGLGQNDANTFYVSLHSQVGIHFRYGGTTQAGNVYLADNSSFAFINQRWQHIAITWKRNGNSTTIRLYQNGMLVGTTVSGLTINLTGPFYIGGAPGLSAFGSGKMDDIQVWSLAKSSTEMQALFHQSNQQNTPYPQPGLISLINFNAGYINENNTEYLTSGLPDLIYPHSNITFHHFALMGNQSNIVYGFNPLQPIPNVLRTYASDTLVTLGGQVTLSLNFNPAIIPGTTLTWQRSDNIYFVVGTVDTLTSEVVTVTENSYYRCIVVIPNVGTMISVPVLVKVYCQSISNLSRCNHNFSEYIHSLNINSLNYVWSFVGGNQPCTGFWDLTIPTNYSSGIAPTTTLQRGQKPILTVNCGNYYPGDQVSAWIDFNQNGIFDEPSERFDSQGFYFDYFWYYGVFSMQVPIPYSALPGLTRMRVRETYSDFIMNPCGTSQYGETVDFLVTIDTNVVFNSPGNAVVAPTCLGNVANLSLSNTSLNVGATYQWEQCSDSLFTGSITLLGTQATQNVTFMDTNLYYRCKVTVPFLNQMEYSTSIRIPLNPYYNCYCSASNFYNNCTNSSNNEYIHMVILDSLNVTSFTNCNFYTDYTNIPPGPNQNNGLGGGTGSTTLVKGLAYPITVHVQNPLMGDVVTVWIDLNHNGSFNDLNEMYFLGSVIGPVLTSSITLPSWAMDGKTRMRVRLSDWWNANLLGGIKPCGEEWYGEVEDYVITIVDACNMVSSPGNTISNVGYTTVGSTVHLSVQFPFPSATYQWQEADDSLFTQNVVQLGNASTQQITASTSRYYRCQTSCGSMVYYSTPKRLEVYCHPINNVAGPLVNDQIAEVNVFSSVNPIQSVSTVSSTYMSYISTIPAAGISRLENVPMLLWTFAPNPSQAVGVWIDYNQNTIFETTEYLNLVSPGLNSPFVGVFTVPMDAKLGFTMMRIRSNANAAAAAGTACDTYISGETEDYLVQILPYNCTNLPAPGNTLASATSVNAGTNVVLELEHHYPNTSLTYLWQQAEDIGFSTNVISLGTDSVQTVNVQSSRYYRCVLTCGGTTKISNPVWVKRCDDVMEEYQSVCNFPITWNGILIPSAGQYSVNLTNANGCDSVVHLQVDSSDGVDVQSYSLSEDTICNNNSFEVVMNQSESDVLYTLMDANSNLPLSVATIGTGGPLTISSNILTASATVNLYAEKIINGGGNALQFDGMNDYLQSTMNVNPNEGTWEAWVKKENWQTQNDEHLFGNGIHFSDSNSFYLSLHPGVGLHARHGGVNQAGNTYAASTEMFSWTPSSWHHIAFTWKDTANTVKLELIVDGVKKASSFSSVQINLDSTFYVGGSGNPLNALFKGTLDEVRVWNYAKTAEQITSTMHSCTLPDQQGLLTYWNMNQSAGSQNATDVSVNANDANLMNMDPQTSWVSGAFICESCNMLMPMPLSVSVINCPTSTNLQLKWILQGYYSGSGTMSAVLLNQGIGNSIIEVDSVWVELKDPLNFSSVAFSKAILHVDGSSVFGFDSVFNGYYYLLLKHRNHLETWSAEPVLITANSTYDFSTAANKAYGSNQVQVENGIWAFFTGDINQDGVVDGLDYNDWENDSNNFAGGYFSTDLNGDGIVDGLDFIFWEQNSNNFVGAVVP